MFENLKLIIKNSYSPLSNYKVACVLKCKNGQEFIGVNIENPSFKSGLCAEQVAIGSAISEGYKSEDFDSLYVLGSGSKICTPCFLCRELLVEFFDANARVVCYNKSGKSKEFLISDLCPNSFELEW